MTELAIKFYPIYQHDSGSLYAFLHYQAVQYINQPEASQTVIQFGTTNSSATPYPIFSDIATARAFFDATKAAEVVAGANAIDGSSYFTTYDIEEIDPPVGAALNGIMTALSGKQPLITAGAHIADAATNAATNATTNLATNYTLLSGLLGIADGLNSANTAQNDMAVKYNALAVKCNDLAGKFDTLLDRLEAEGLLATS